MADVTAGLNQVGLDFYNNALKAVTGEDRTKGVNGTTGTGAFAQILDSAMNLIKETDSLSRDAEQAAVDFTLGNTDSTHELTVAQQKAYISLQYTVAVKNAFLDAYKEIMQIQI